MTLTTKRLRMAFGVAAAIGCVDKLAGTAPAAPVVEARFLPGEERGAALAAAPGEKGGYQHFYDVQISQYVQHPTVWHTASATIDLSPAPHLGGQVLATDGFTQGGYVAGSAINLPPMAALWRGSAASFVSLQPIGATSSKVHDLAGGVEVGEATYAGKRAATLWHGTSESATNLHAPWLGDESVVNATDGIRQAGAAHRDGHWHAVVWQGSAGSGRILSGLEGSVDSEVLGLDGAQLVGSIASHAVLWDANTEAATDLMPVGAGSGIGSADAVADGVQVGEVSLASNGWHSHAYLWFGTGESAIDLHLGFDDYMRQYGQSVARDVVRTGDVIEVSGYFWWWWGEESRRPVTWTVYIPEPHSIPLLAGGVAMTRRRRRREN